MTKATRHLEFFFHKEDVGCIQFPSIMVRTELRGLSEQLLHDRIVLSFPIDSGHSHQNRNIALKRCVVHLRTVGHERIAGTLIKTQQTLSERGLDTWRNNATSCQGYFSADTLLHYPRRIRQHPIVQISDFVHFYLLCNPQICSFRKAEK